MSHVGGFTVGSESGQDKITTPEMECALANFFGYRANLIVPNVHWGMDLHECDLLVITRMGYAWEIEIKVSKADLKRDAEKWHGHRSRRIKRLYFAIPIDLEGCADLIPERAGIIIVRPRDEEYGPNLRCRITRKPVTNKAAQPFTDAERYKVARLGALRIWGLKRKLLNGAVTSNTAQQ